MFVAVLSAVYKFKAGYEVFGDVTGQEMNPVLPCGAPAPALAPAPARYFLSMLCTLRDIK